MTSDDRSTAEIERDIERERAELQDTLQEIRDRYSVEAIARQVGRQFQEHGGDIGRSVIEQVKANPLPLALTGIGLAWLMAGRGTRTDQGYERYADYGYRDRYLRGADRDLRRSEFGPEYYDDDEFARDGEEDELDADHTRSRGSGSGLGSMASGAASGIGSVASKAAGMVSGSWDSARSASGRMRHSAAGMLERMYEGTQDMTEEAKARVVAAREAAYDAQRRMEDMLRRRRREMTDLFESQPLVVGALAMAAGAALGGILPRTNVEDEAMGDERDRLIEEAERIYQQERSKLGAVMGAAASAASEVLREARDEVTATGPGGRSMADAAKNRARDAVNKVVDRTREEVEEQGVGDLDKPASGRPARAKGNR